MVKNKSAIIILGDQLLAMHPALDELPEAPVIMIEADDICSSLPYHKHKLILVLAAMRHYAAELEKQGRRVIYRKLQKGSKHSTILTEIIESEDINQLAWMSTSSKQPNQRLEDLATQKGLKISIYSNQLFLLERDEFDDWFDSQKQPMMENFYRWYRKKTGLLMVGKNPVGSAWNYDKQNRKPLPKSALSIPEVTHIEKSSITETTIKIVDELYYDNPGKSDNFWLPVSRSDSLQWLDNFIENKLAQFGDYEDAMKEGEPFIFHSTLSPLLNIGLISPPEAIDRALEAFQKGKAPINSVEGFIRQIAGWREYMHGLYWNKQDLIDANFFGFTKQLEDWWYTKEYTSQALPPPVKHALKTVHSYGYNHHIERLMVLGNWFLLNEYDPKSVYRWFSSMYVDAYEWVMVPNVQGMSQYADGGFVATKPYISGGNYLQKMGRFWDSLEEAKASDFNRLYWQFLKKHKDKLSDNPRMSIALMQAERML